MLWSRCSSFFGYQSKPRRSLAATLVDCRETPEGVRWRWARNRALSVIFHGRRDGPVLSRHGQIKTEVINDQQFIKMRFFSPTRDRIVTNVHSPIAIHVYQMLVMNCCGLSAGIVDYEECSTVSTNHLYIIDPVTTTTNLKLTQ